MIPFRNLWLWLGWEFCWNLLQNSKCQNWSIKSLQNTIFLTVMLLNLKNSFILLPKDTKILNENKRVKMNWPQNLIFFKLIKWWVWLTEWQLQIPLNLKSMRIKWRVYNQKWYKKILSFLKDSFWCLRDWVSWRKITNEHILYQQMKYLSLFLDLNVYYFVLNKIKKKSSYKITN